MLQTIREKSSGWIAFVILGLVIITMAFFGIESYFSPKIETYAAKIEGPAKFWIWGKQVTEIDQAQFQRRFEQVRREQRASQGDAFDHERFESIENKRQVLEGLIDEEVLALVAEREGILVGEAQVAAELKQMPEFQANGTYSPDQYRLGLAARGLTHAQFMSSVAADLARRILPSQVAASGLASPAEVEAFLVLQRQTRSLQLLDLPTPAAPEAPTDEALQAWYQSHEANYRKPEQLAIDYVEIDAASLELPTVVDEQTLRQRYDEQRARFVTEPRRSAAHILVAVAADADDAAVEAARAKAEDLAARARADGADFAALARENSDDIGSKADGGFLGPVDPGTLGDAFEKALFAMDQPGQVSDPVRTPEGWHVIQLADLTPGSERTFDEVRAELEAEVLSTERERAFGDLVNGLVEHVYKNPTALGPAAEQSGLKVSRSVLFSRDAGTGIAAIPEVRSAAFSEAQRVERQVSDAVEIGPNHVVVMQVVEVEPEATLPFEDVRDRVRADLVADTLSKASEAQAKALLDRALAGESLEALATEVGRTVATLPDVPRVAQMPPALVEEAFRLPPPADGKPSVGMVRLGADRHALVAVTAITPGKLEGLDEATLATLRDQYAQARGLDEAQAYVQALRRQFTIKVAEDRL